MHVISIKAAEFHWIILVCMLSFTPVVVYINIFSMPNFTECLHINYQLDALIIIYS